MGFDAFDSAKLDVYAAQAKASWGETAAYKEFEQKAAGRGKEQEASLAGQMMAIFAEFGAVKDGDPASVTAQALAGKLQDFITEHYYTCTKEIFGGLGKMYAAGGEFTENIDKAGGQGTAAFAAAAIDIYCRK